MPEAVFDHSEVLAALKHAALDAWNKLRSLDPPEHVYGLILYEGAEHGYVCASGFTEDGLDRVTEEYRRGEWGEEYEGPEGREMLRWSAQDSPHHALAEVSSPPLLSGDELYADGTSWADDDGADERYKRAVRALCVQALHELDENGVFADRRVDLTLYIEDRDGSETLEEIREIVADLNPAAVAERFDDYLRRVAELDS